MTPLLAVAGLTKDFAGVRAIADLDVAVDEGAAVGLIGPNGAGKTSFFNLVSGIERPTAGTVTFAGRDITAMAPHRIAQLGMSRTFQNIRLFRQLTVLQNVLVAQQRQARAGLRTLVPFLRPRRERALRSEALELLDHVGLVDAADRTAGALPYAAQRRLEIARALASHPRLVLLDEPAAGMLPRESEELVEQIRRIKERDVTVVLVEHEMTVVMGVCERIVVLNFGVKIAEATPDEVQRDPAVIEAYLGAPAEAGVDA